MRKAYSAQEVATALKVSLDAVGGLSELVHGARRDVFSADDLVLLRAAKQLVERRVSKPKVREALLQLSTTPSPVVGAPVEADGRETVVRVGAHRWNASSGQSVMDFGRSPAKVAWLRPAPVRDAEQLFARACALEETDVVAAIDAYEETVAADPYHADAHVNLGRLLHQHGRLPEAEAHYVAALVARPDDVTASFNLAVVIDDLGRVDDAISRYGDVLKLDPRCTDAYFNLSRLFELKGEKMAALRHLNDYRRLSRP